MNKQEVFDKVLETLQENKIKKSNITEYVEDDLIHFSVKDFTYFVFIEDENSLQFGIHEIENVNLSPSFFANHIIYEDLNYLEEFLGSIKENYYDWIKKTWKTLEKLIDDIGSDEQVEEIVKEFYNIN